MNLGPALITSAICLIGLIFFRSVRNLSAPPTIILTDSKKVTFHFPTLFRVQVCYFYFVVKFIKIFSVDKVVNPKNYKKNDHVQHVQVMK